MMANSIPYPNPKTAMAKDRKKETIDYRAEALKKRMQASKNQQNDRSEENKRNGISVPKTGY